MSTRTTGQKGEDIACKYLVKQGFTITDRNYSKKWGELDVVATKDSLIHFFEVKSVVSMGQTDGHRPEENVHSLKQRHIRRIIETYLGEKRGMLDVAFQFHVLCVYLNIKTSRARLKWIKNVIL
jgi:putative endonuclease